MFLFALLSLGGSNVLLIGSNGVGKSATIAEWKSRMEARWEVYRSHTKLHIHGGGIGDSGDVTNLIAKGSQS